MESSLIPSRDPIERIERAMRDVIHDVLSNEFGPAWTEEPDANLGAEWASGLREKQLAERSGPDRALRLDIPISYAEFPDLARLVNKHRSLFEPVFPDWDTLAVYLATAERLRNTVKHHRDITTEQHALLMGIAGEVEDAIALWRLGIHFDSRRVAIEYLQLIPASERGADEVLEDIEVAVADWRERFLAATEAEQRDPRSIRMEELEDSVHIRVQQAELTIEDIADSVANCHIDGMDYKAIRVTLAQNSGAQFQLSELIDRLERSYRQITYELGGTIDLEALKRWSTERGGLDPTGTVAVDDVLSAVDFRLLGGRLRVAASNSPDRKGRHVGKISATVDPPDGLWRAHETLTHQELLGYMVGNIAPRTMMNLLALARQPYRSPLEPEPVRGRGRAETPTRT